MTDHQPLTTQRHDETEPRQHDRRERYMAALNSADNYALINCRDDRARFADAVMTVADAEITAALLADNQRLRQQVAFLLKAMARKDARTGDGGRALAEFLTADPNEDDDETAAARPAATTQDGQP